MNKFKYFAIKGALAINRSKREHHDIEVVATNKDIVLIEVDFDIQLILLRFSVAMRTSIVVGNIKVITVGEVLGILLYFIDYLNL